MKKIKTKSGFEYFIKGNSPKLIIHSGTHGDELGVIESVKKAAGKFEDKLGDFLYVPEVSPSAVVNKSRKNGEGHDMNRIFLPSSKNIEVQENIKLLKKYKTDFVVSFHEDLDRKDEVYIYDCSFDKEDLSTKKWLKEIQSFGVKPLNGVDDPSDPDLNLKFVNGYRFFLYKGGEKINGMIVDWVLEERLSKRFQIVEIPGLASQTLKDMLVNSYFEDILMAKSSLQSKV